VKRECGECESEPNGRERAPSYRLCTDQRAICLLIRTFVVDGLSRRVDGHLSQAKIDDML